MLRAPLDLFKKAAGWLAPAQVPEAEKPTAASGPAAGEEKADAGAVEVVLQNKASTEGGIDPSCAGTYTATERFTIITAVYNVELYLDDFFTSIVNQTVDFWSHIEVIVVDDGSTDNSAEICKKWIERFPGRIRYFKQENAGQGSARNHGLRYARNDWVTFIDPDDFISQDYFEHIDKAIRKAAGNARPLRVIATRLVFYYENIDEYQDTHPLRYRFAKGDVYLPASNLGKNILLSAACAVFWRGHLMAERLSFDLRIKPAFEDAHLVNRYLISVGEADVAFLAGPKYYYRKRSDATSTLDTGWLHPGRYGDQLRHGSLGLIEYCLQRKGEVPAFVQRTLLYDICWHIKRLVNDDPLQKTLDAETISQYWGLVQAVMGHISEKTILEFDLAGIWFFHKLGMLSVFKQTEPEFNIVYCGRYDSIKCLLELRYFSRKEYCTEDIRINGSRVVPAYSTTRCHWMMGAPFLYERSLWVEVRNGKMVASIAGKPAWLSAAGKQYRTAAPMHEILAALRTKTISEKGLPLEVAELRRAAKDLATLRKYGGCWLLMDRDTQADDNAEHLYRFLAQKHPEIKAYFVLRADSPDWARLASEGFHLIEFGSQDHKLALLNADHLVSSHADAYIFGDLEKKYYQDLISYRYTFLQHGVTKDDLSRWLNHKEIACLVTATGPEYKSIVDGPNYKFSAKEVVLTGFPRHDRLLSLRGNKGKVIMIMPTWRNSLMGEFVGQGTVRSLNPDFHDSQYALCWGTFLRSPELKRIAESGGYEVVFFPHPNVAPYIEGFGLPDYVRIGTLDAAESIQEMFGRAAVMVTDYSSVAFEVAYIDRPVIYFQFDREVFFSGAHTYQKGYYDYDHDGFGPVCKTVDEALSELAQVVGSGCVPALAYQARIERTFALRDGLCCERTYEAIAALDLAIVPEQARQSGQLEFARRAFAFGEWEDAHKAWQQLRGCEGVPQQEAVFNLAVCARKLGWIEVCETHLAEAQASGFDSELLLREQAALCAALDRFEDAIESYTRWRKANVPARDDTDFMADMARAYRLSGGAQQAAVVLADVEEASHPRILREYAELASMRQNWDEAAQRWADVVAASNDADAVMKLADALLQLGRGDEAREAIAGLPWEPMPSDMARRRAELAYRLLDWKSAARAWSLVVEAAGELAPDEWLKFAKACRKRGELGQAEEALAQAQGSLDERTLLQERALLLSALARWPEAVEAWQAFLERRDLSPNRDAWLYLARAQMNMGELETALRTVRRFARARGDTDESLALQTEITLAMERAQESQGADTVWSRSTLAADPVLSREDATPAEATA